MGKGEKTRFYADVMAFHPEVTGSCLLVVVKFPNETTLKFMVDCGLFQEKDYYQLNGKMFCNPNELGFVLVTHNHVDHTGRLPFLVKKGFNRNIYMTRETAKLIPLALDDSVSVLEDVAKRNGERPLYVESDVQKTIKNIKSCNYDEAIYITPNVKATFLKNGHLIGAASILVQISYPEYEDINLLFTGDYNNKNMFFDVPEIPEWIRKLPITVIQEATYGDKRTVDLPAKCFEENVVKAIANEKSVIVPVFSLGRAQEILYVLKTMQESGRMAKNVPIYFDGKLAFKYTNIYQSGNLGIKPEMMEFLPENLEYVDSEKRQELLRDYERKIIVTTSGMGSYGPAQTYIPTYVKRENALIHFTGYTTEGTLGSKLKNTSKGDVVDIGCLLVVKIADVEYTSEFSAHAKADELIDFLNKFEDIKLVLVNHGQSETKHKFADSVVRNTDAKYVGILGEGYLFRVNHYGFVKSMTTKFI